MSADALKKVAERYAVAITPHLQTLIANDPQGPVAAQFVPRAEELDIRPEELPDPIGDNAHSPLPGLVHRHPDRVLLKPVHTCPSYCRYCFRREMVGPGKERMSEADLARAYDYLRANTGIWEVIMSGGEPLILPLQRMRAIGEALADIAHIKILRWHTRVPVVDPERVTDELVQALKAKGKTTYVVVHINHVKELSPQSRAALDKMADAGIPLLSQSVLLKGVNDNAQALEDLFRALIEARVKPYYLHQTDLAPGTAHFRTTIQAGQALMKDLRGKVSGLCQPTYVLDIPGGYGKVPIGPMYLEEMDAGWCVCDPQGKKHAYPAQP